MIGQAERREMIASGSSKIAFPLLLVVDSKHQDETLWYRLRYRIAPDPPSSKTFTPVTGVISLSEITPDIFELRVIASEYPFAGKLYRAHVRALHPITARAVGGVQINANLKFDNDRKDSFKATAITTTRGYAALDFNLPRDLIAEDGNLEIKAIRGDFKQEAEIELRDEHLRLSRILLTTDKPIYQPDQTLHVRALAFDFNNRAIANAELELEIEDPEGTTQFRTDLKTSRFGVASIDWQIPENARLGDYHINIWMDDDKHGEARMTNTVKITRYELPNYAVKTKPDRDYYLPGQNAEVEIRADYLFGQPVTKGHVRVVREKDRHWNYREQKWETEEAEKYEGETDASGRFVARIDLANARKNFSDEDYKRFEDLTYAAYFTDATTGRTEQKRFDLRLTREPIHIYVIGLDYNQSDALPMQFYVSTSYADGKPAECEVTISQKSRKGDWPLKREQWIEEPLLKIKTNRHGVAKVSGLQLRQSEAESGEFALAFNAHDRNDKTGSFSENVSLRDRLAVRVETDKAVYRAGEAIEVYLAASKSNVAVVLNVSRELQVLHSQLVRLRNGKAFVVLPYRTEFKDELTISVAGDDGEGDACCNDYHNGRHRVIYPRDHELKLDVRMSAAEYRPGEEARASFRVLDANGRPVESALGVSVIDRAVEERARTDSEFGERRHYGFASQLFNSQSLAGFTVRDLCKLDLSQPVPDELQLIAEILLREGGYIPRVESSEQYLRDQQRVFSALTQRQFTPLQGALNKQLQKTGEYPRDRTSLERILNVAEINFEVLRDPWGVPYRTGFGTERERDYFTAISAGADKKFDTGDDFTAFSKSWPYFAQIGERIQRIAGSFSGDEGRTTLDRGVFTDYLKRNGLDFDALRDRWDNAYAIDLNVYGINWLATIRSSGANGKFELPGQYPSDDFNVWAASVDYFAGARARIDAVLASHFKTAGSLPEKESVLGMMLKANGIEFNSLCDPYGNGLYATFSDRSRYTDRVVIRYNQLQEANKIAIKSVTERINFISLRSRGADGKEGTADDFTLAEFSRVTAEQSGEDQKPKATPDSPPLAGGTGAIKGIVADPQGASVAGSTVEVTNKASQVRMVERTDNEGRFLMRNLPSGMYQLRCEAQGFKAVIIEDIAVRSATMTEVNLVVEVGTVSEAVMITGGGGLMETQNASVSMTQVANLPLNSRKAMNLVALKPGIQVTAKSDTSTPRLREHFQETLVWQPQLETDKQGRAQLKFKLADNITTWKLAVIGSTVDGQIGFAEKEFLAFQPFFAEHDPPRVLTEGDQIALPVVLRNYLNKSQNVTTEMKPESWFTLLGAARQQTNVAAGDAAKAIFDFRVMASVKDGKQRVTAIGGDASDAIEKPVSVHPDGEELAQTASGIFTNEGRLNITVPEDAIKGSVRAELKIYPNLMAHAVEGIEGILQRPYGCGEQTISSTYPNVMALRYLKQQDESAAAIAAKAQRYAQAGYERLLGYRSASGGFTYWGRGEADLALTAYAVRFLNDASEFVDVDDDVIAKARDWVIAAQQADGSWQPRYYGSDKHRTTMTTAYIARVLATERKRTEKPDKKLVDSLQLALKFLAARSQEIDEPYVIASYALAAMDAGGSDEAAKAVSKLRQLARDEAGTAYWHLESNTPFYGWGLAGRIETTALAVKALQQDKQMRADTKRDELVDRGLLFLLRNKDRYGVWLSTQATINVLDTLASLYESEKVKVNAGGQAEILVNGKRVSLVEMTPGNRLSNPLAVDLSSALNSGENRIEIRRAGDVTLATAQLVETHYAVWKTNAGEGRENVKPGKSSALRLAVSYDKPQVKIGDEVTCNVAAERIGYRGDGQYGMLLAEIGLPPGADVDRASLEAAVKESGWELNHYDVLPDRVVVYLWPRAGGTKFSFKFKLRYGINAQSAPSVLYDYYNPEARAVIAPTRFVAK
ncbi:MAG: MG2 domain-containing protein [Acidobacteriota bacterium]